jgi:(S)-3,5-dihydroxyphenylglycine transaminase
MTPKRDVEVKACFSDPLLDVMNFLNEITFSFPDAISFAPGRPRESWFEVDRHVTGLAAFVDDAAQTRGISVDMVWQELGQYGRTNGAVTALLGSYLERDEGIRVAPDAIMVTVGAQEAMAIVLMGLFEAERDVLLVSDPTYVGITGLARLLGIRVVPVASGDGGLDPDAVDRAVMSTSKTHRVRALYDIPDFNNPLGTSLSIEARLALLDVCRRHGVLIIEDNPYGAYAYDHAPRPTLKALDTEATVIYIGSFSKTLFPGLRVGYLVADQRVTGTGETLARSLSRVKSLLTVNTSPLAQAMVAAALQRGGGSLERIVAPKRAACRAHRDAMLAALEARFGAMNGDVVWNRPSGGFFLTLTLPCDFGPEELRRGAAEHGVIVSPMRFFCLGQTRARQVRLAFSYTTPREIDAGIDRFAGYLQRLLTQAVAVDSAG